VEKKINRCEHEREREDKSKQKMKNGTTGSVQLVAWNKPKSPHHAILTGELAWRSKVQGRRGKGERKISQDSARSPYSRRTAGVERKGTDHPRKSKANAMKERSSWSSRLKDEKA